MEFQARVLYDFEAVGEGEGDWSWKQIYISLPFRRVDGEDCGGGDSDQHRGGGGLVDGQS